MRRKFTFLTAAFMLLAFFIPSMIAVGQTRTNVTDHMTSADLAATGTSYTNFSNVSLESDAVYAGNSAREYYNSQYNIQMRSNNSNSGIVTTTSGGTIVSITINVSHGTNTIDVYGKNTAYSAASDLYNSSTQGTKIGSLSATGTINVADGYEYIGIRSKSGAIYLSSVDFEWNPGGTPTPIVETPTFSVEEGTYTEAQTVSINCATSGATIYYTTDGTDPTTSSNVYSSALTISETTTVKAMATKADMNNSAIATATYTINLPYSGPDYVRITNINDLSDGDRVIIAARYNSTATSYYAMTAATTGKPTGVAFISTTSNNGEILPSDIVNNENTYYWTVNVTSNGYTFTNANNKVLGYTSSTNFAEGGNNTEWTITRNTAGNSAMVSGYEGFNITNKNISGRGVALNNQHNYGPYATSNYNSSDYNFFLDIFVQGYVPAAVATPTFTPAEGTYYTSQNVTINCETQNADIYYTIDGSTPDANSTHYTGSISVAATTTINAIAYYGGANSNVATATYTIVPPLSTMDQIFAAATSAGNTAATVHIAFDNWVVTGANNSSHAFVSDGTNGFMIYGSGHGFSAGDVLSGTVECKVQLYNGAIEITQLTSATTGLTVTTGGTVTVANIAMANLAGINTGALVSYQNLTCEARVEGNYTNYYLSDGTTEIQAYKTLLNNYADYLEDGKTYNITGVFVLNNSTKRINPRSADDIEEVEVQHEEYTLTVSNLSHVNLFIFGGEESETIISTEDGETTAQVYDGTEVLVSIGVEAGYVFQSLTITDGNGNAVETEELTPNEYYSFLMPASNVTITATAEVLTGDNYELFSGTLVEGDYLIVYDNGAMNNTVTSDRLQYETVTATNDVITTDNAAIVWHIAPSGDYWTIYSADADAYVASTGAKNKAQMLADGTDDKALWTVSGTETYEFVNKQNTTNEVNANLRKNGTYGFACYATGTGGALSLYKKVEPATESYTLIVTGYDSGNGGWNLIASPVTVNPANVEGMVVESTDPNYQYFDLYYYDETGGTNGMEWKNYKANVFNLVPGKGYLYANANTVNLTFTGEMNSDFEDVDLPYDETDYIKSLYLAGNSKTTAETFYVYDESLNQQTFNYLTMNQNGDGFITNQGTSFEAQALQGFFVQSDGDGWTLSTVNQEAKSGTPELLNIMVNRNRGTLVDNVLVSFSNAPMMNKFYLNNNSTRIYIPQNGEEMAVVRSEGQGEMPVNFRANENGQYTFTVNLENVEMNYLHLIDNMTGADIDLLQTPNYSFEATTRDHESRFRLVFAAKDEDGSSTGSGTFAFYSNGSFIISNDGNAMLQVIDINGRILSNHSINGSTSVTMNAAPGVYMLRLINGETVKVQKVVVE